jgi:NAD(P)H-nitrite reductase large subunit
MKILIIGNGIAGITAARNIRKQDAEAEICVISKETPYFFSRTALMYVFMGHMKFEHTQPYENSFWSKNRIDLLQDEVLNIDFDSKSIGLKNSSSRPYDKLILATGSLPNLMPIKGLELEGVQGFYSKNDLDKIELAAQSTQKAIIVGGGLIGVEVAEMLISRGIKVDFLVREQSFWRVVLPAEESAMISDHIQSHGVNLMFETEIESINGFENKVNSITTKSGENIDCSLVCMTIGVHPNIDFLKNTALKTERGILVDEFLATNRADVFAVGDCVQHLNPPPNRRTIEQIWYSGRMMGEVVAANVLGKKIKYKPGVFFNSAKFFNIEYQTYGTVSSEIDDSVRSFHWKHEKENILVRLNYDADSQCFIGLNTFGIRMKHEVVVNWIETKKSIQFVVQNLKKANFDPEFFNLYENKIIDKFNFENKSNLQTASTKNWFQKIFNS